MAVLSAAHAHLVRRRGALPLAAHDVVVVVRGGRVVDLHLLLHVLNARVNGVVLFLAVGRGSRPNILDRAAARTLKVTALLIEMLKHFDN